MMPDLPNMPPSPYAALYDLLIPADDELLDELIAHTVQVAKGMGLLKSRTLIVDATHSRARYGQKPIGQAIIEEAKRLRHACYKETENAKGRFPEKVDESNIDQLLTYALGVAETVESGMPELMAREHIRDRVNRVRELAEDAHVELQVSKDSDARTGHKSADSSFFGYKHHLAMTEEGIITAVIVTSGEASDCHQLGRLVQKSHRAGAEFDHIVGDSAYSSRDNLIYAASQGCKLVAPLNPQVYSPSPNRVEGFTYNKDAERYVCPAGHMAVRKTRGGRKNAGTNPVESHFFDIELCKQCPLRKGCYKDGAKSKSYSVSLKSREHSDQLDCEQTDDFKEHRRKRFAIEAKNSQLKNTHGLARNKTSDLKGMTLQSAMAIIAVNLKRIISLHKEKTG